MIHAFFVNSQCNSKFKLTSTYINILKSQTIKIWWKLSPIFDYFSLTTKNHNSFILMKDTVDGIYHWFDYEIDDNIFEADLTGKGATYIDSNGGPLDKSKGLIIFLDAYIDSKEPRETDLKTVVKSVQLLKGTEHKNSQLDLAGAYFVNQYN